MAETNTVNSTVDTEKDIADNEVVDNDTTVETKKNRGRKAANSTRVTDTSDDVLEEDLNLDAKVTVKNLAGWDVTFARLQDGVGDVVIVANGQQRLSRNEITAQVNNGNKLFVGSDGAGSHATLYIADEPTRKWVGFEELGRPQMVFTDEIVKKLFEMNQRDYENNLPLYICTRAEKYALMDAIKRLNLNDYAKIVFACKYTGYNYQV